VSKRNYQDKADCQVNFETLLFLGHYLVNMSARETAELLLLVGRRLRRGGILFGSGPRLMGGGSRSALRTKAMMQLRAIRSKLWCARWARSTRKCKPRCATPCATC